MRIQLSKPMSLEDLKRITGGIYEGDESVSFTHLATNSEEALSGDLFLALRGERFDANDLTPHLTARGVFVIGERYFKNSLLVGSTRAALLALASHNRHSLPNLKYTVAITGSVGKTTTKEFLRHLLSVKYRVHASEGNFNNEIGLPLSILSAPLDTEVLILEMGMNHAGEIEALSRCAAPTHAVITNIGTAHIGSLGSRRGIAMAKSEIACGMSGGPIFTPFGEPLLEGLPHRTEVSLEGEGEVYIRRREDGQLDFSFFDRRLSALPTSLCSKDALSALAYSLSVGISLGLSDDALRLGVSRIPTDALRRRIYQIGALTVYDDSYNASYEAMLSSLDAFRAYAVGERAALVGDMLELGHMSEACHRALGAHLAKEDFSEVYLFGVYMPFVIDEMKKAGFPPERIHMNTDLTAPSVTAEAILKHTKRGTLFAKASRGVRLEGILKILSEGKEKENA